MNPTKPFEYVAAVKGAASYVAYDTDVYMIDTDGHESCIQCCRSTHAAQKAAIKWQKKENAAVLKSQKQKK